MDKVALHFQPPSAVLTIAKPNESEWLVLLGLLPCVLFFIVAVPEVVRVYRRDEKESPSLSGRSTFFTKIVRRNALIRYTVLVRLN